MSDPVNSDKIVWSDAAVNELRDRIAEQDGYDKSMPEDWLAEDDYLEEIVEYLPPPAPPGVPPVPTTPAPPTIPIPVPVILNFPWPISVKSSTFWYGADMKSNADVVLTAPDVEGVTEYEFRIARA